MPFARPKTSCDARPDAKIAAGIVFVAADGDVLLLRRSADEKNFGGHWGLPGGGGEDGETAQDAAVRECKEEIQVDIDPDLKVMDRVDTPSGMQFTTFAKAADAKFVPVLDSEHSGYCWASLDMLPQPLHPQVARVLGEHIGAAADMTPEDWDGLRTGLAKWTREEEAEPEHSEDGMIEIPHKETIVRPKDFFFGMPGRGAADARLAMDRRLYDAKGKRIMGHDVMALDRAPSSRTYDADGHLHLTRTPISKANVCEYWGHEIPDADKLGLDPQKLYRLLRDPEELAKAAASSNGKQLMLGHVPVSADDPQKDVQVGSTGTDAEFDGTYLYNSLHIHDRKGIDAIERADRGEQASDETDPDKGAKELSSAYRYRMDPTPGEYKGEPYDGVMRDIDFNHVALVPEGRAGADVVVGDSQLKKEPTMKVLSRFAGASAVALGMYLQPRLAADAKIDLNGMLDGVTKKNFAEKKAKLAADIKAKAKLAKDANLDDMHEFIDRLEKQDVAEGADADPDSGLPMSKEDMDKKAKDEAEAKAKEEKEAADKKAADRKAARDAFLKEKGMDEKDIEAMDALCSEDAEESESEEKDEKKPAKDKKGLDKKAMDAALASQRAELRAAAEAREFVEPWVGKVSLALDSAPDIYRTALKGLGMDAKEVDALHVDALKPVLQAQQKPGEKKVTVANDAAAADTTGFSSRWGDKTKHIAG